MPKLGQALPMYAQLRDILAGRISSQTLPPGARVPSERELCKEFGVSKHTVIRALSDLVAKGLVERMQGKGTFVATASPRLGTIRFIFYRTASGLHFDPYYAPALGALEHEISPAGYDLVTCSIRDDRDPLAPNDAGYFLVGPIPDEIAERAVARRVPVVTLDHSACPLKAGVVAFDEIASAEMAVNVLLKRGFRKIGYVGAYDSASPERREWPNSVLRCEGVKKALAAAGLPLSEDRIILLGDHKSEYEPALKNMLSGGGLPDAFVVFGSYWVIELTSAAEKLGMSIAPESIVTFGALGAAPPVPGMTLIAGDTELLGTRAARMLLDAFRSPGSQPGRVLLPRRVE